MEFILLLVTGSGIYFAFKWLKRFEDKMDRFERFNKEVDKHVQEIE